MAPSSTLYLSTGSHSFDSVLQGGLRTGCLTEICGESGSGKTQICLQCCLTAQLPLHKGGLLGSSLYIHTNGPFPVSRLATLGSHMKRMYGIDGNMLDRVKVKKVSTLDELLLVTNQLQQLLERPSSTTYPLRVVVIDSVTALCRTAFPHTYPGMMERNRLLKSFAKKIKELATKFSFAAIVINEVSDFFPTDNDSEHKQCVFMSSGRLIQASLGVKWEQHLDTRLFITSKFRTTTIKDREVHLASSKYLPCSSVSFHIIHEGVF